MVESGELPFDRTMRISTAEVDAKGTISKRIPANLNTIRKMLAAQQPRLGKAQRRFIFRRRWTEIRFRLNSTCRKAVTLLEELSLRTSRVIPLMKKLQSISTKLSGLKQNINDKTQRLTEDDQQAMQEEFAGLTDLVREDPDAPAAALPEDTHRIQ